MPSPHEKAYQEGYAKGMAEGDEASGWLLRMHYKVISELQAQNTALQAHNTELLLRARKAESAASPAALFAEENGGVWGEHQTYTPADWRAEVENGDTRSGYWEWVVAQVEANKISEKDGGAQ